MVETSQEILTKRSHTFFNPVDVHSAADFINNHAEYHESGKLDFSCGQVVNDLKAWERFPNQMNRNHLASIHVGAT